MERRITRRRALHCASGLVLAAALPASAPAASDLTGRLARYMAGAAARPLPERVARATKRRILDTLAAMVSGATLPPGKLAIDYVRAQGGAAEACVAATDIVTSAVNAAFANGMLAHADETDDFHAFTKAHPGCSTVPAALAMAERERASGASLMSSVALGYDLCCRFLTSLGPDALRDGDRSVEAMSATFGAAAAAAAIARFDETRMRFAISYAAQQVSGAFTWERDDEHVEKAFDFGGMGARNGVAAVTMIRAGFTGVSDVLDGERNALDALRAAGAEPEPERLVEALGERFYIEETAIKTYPVGYPIQAPLDAFLSLVREQRLKPDDVRRIVARLPADGARIVDGRAMPDVNCQHILAVALVDGAITLENSHARERMIDPRVLAVRERVELVADPALVDPAAPRSGRVEVTLADGRQLERFVKHPPGTPENPLDDAAVNGKARGLIEPVLGAAKTDALIRRVNALEQMADARELRALLAP